MEIKMRISKNQNAKCDSCGKGKEKSLEVFDIMVGDKIITVCDECLNELFHKTLRASCMVNARLKSNHDLSVIAIRNRKKNENKSK
jgi:hypothetical protein